jgi:hypothetical protein
VDDAARGALCDVAADLAHVDRTAVEQLADELLDHRGPLVRDPALSALNSNGDPLQLVVSATPQGTAVRLLADPSSDEKDPWRRRQRARGALRRALDITGVPAAPFLRMLPQVLPDDPWEADHPLIGEMWIAAPLARRGLAVYTNAAWGRPTERWARLLSWIGHELPGHRALHQILRSEQVRDIVPAAAGIEVAGADDVRIKIYFRLARAVPLATLGLPLLDRPLVTSFLRTVLDSRPLPRSGLVLAVGLRAGSADVDDVKIDVCGCDRCLPAHRWPWPRTLSDLTDQLGLPGRELAVHSADVRPAFLGLGIARSGGPRVNLYLQAAV